MIRDERGFTLIEVLAALVVFGFLIAALAEGTRFGLAGFRAQQSTIARDNDLDATARVIRLLVATAIASEDADAPSVIGNAHELVFTTTAPIELGNPATTEADARLAVHDGALVLTLLPHYHATPLGTAAEHGLDETLVTGLDHVDFAYWDGTAHQWTGNWRSSTPPGLVRLRFAFKDGRRHWPPLIARAVVENYNG